MSNDCVIIHQIVRIITHLPMASITLFSVYNINLFDDMFIVTSLRKKKIGWVTHTLTHVALRAAERFSI